MPRPFLKQIDEKLQKQAVNNNDKAVFILHDQLSLNPWADWIKDSKPLLIFKESREKGGGDSAS